MRIESQLMYSPSRSMMASSLLVIYVLITMSPLAPLVITSPRLAHALTGQCVGDCDICGCAPERRASHTCCCWLNRMKQEPRQEQPNIPECCRKKHQEDTTKLTSLNPCGRNNLNDLWDGNEFEHIPYYFIEGKTAFHGNLPSSFLRAILPIRHDDPPDPPPELTILS